MEKAMGREIRMVPPNWDHPVVTGRNGREGYQPMFDREFQGAAKDWKDGLAKWESGDRPEGYDAQEFWEYEGGPPERAYYRPWSDREATWYQVWETVSEGTPVTPPFATQDELIDYLVAHGDFWDQDCRKRGGALTDCSPWPREAAEKFVRSSGWAPTLVADSSGVRSGVRE